MIGSAAQPSRVPAPTLATANELVAGRDLNVPMLALGHRMAASDLWLAGSGSEAGSLVAMVIELEDESLGSMHGRLHGDVAGDALARAAAETSIRSAMRTQLAQIDLMQRQTEAQLLVWGARPLFKLQRAYNGIAVLATTEIARNALRLPGIKRVRRIQTQSVQNSASVSLIGAAFAWTAPRSLTGRGIKIGIIDTGIDYRHATFGAISGTLPVSNNTAVITDGAGFPNARIVGGYDFAGDRYAANGFGAASEPSPDPDPIDCNGHGTHVAGTAAGMGVLNSGMPYTGSFDAPLDRSTFRIGPGVAPEAELYALKVFGCFGSTDLTDAAIEWAMDPDKDGDFSDHLDVINLSLGSSYGLGDDPTALAVNAAAAAGVIVVASAGNAGDTHFIVGAPAVADRAIAVAGSDDGVSVMDAIVVTSSSGTTETVPALQSSFFVYSPTGASVEMLLRYPVSDTTGCSAFSITDTTVISGAIVLLDWSHVGDAHECGSGTRMQNAFAAGAKGAVLAYDLPQLDITIGGSRDIPSVIVPKQQGDALRGRLKAGEALTVLLDPALNGTHVLSDVRLVDAGYHDSSRGVRLGDSAPKPDLTAPAVTIFSARNGSGDGGVAFNGTSMAAPHVSGQMALLRQRHPFWSVEELKALAMNTARHDVMYVPNITNTLSLTRMVHGPQRVGAGRIDIAAAMESDVVVYNEGGNGRVSLGFGAIEAIEAVTRTRTLRLTNRSMISRTLALRYDTTMHAPGVSVIIEPNRVTLDAFADARVSVRLKFDPVQFQHARDATLSMLQGNAVRDWTTDEGGLLLAEDSVTGLDLRVPLHASVRPVGATHTTGYRKSAIALTIAGQDVQGTGATPTAAISHASALELGYHAPEPFAHNGTEYAQIRAIGAASDFASGHGVLSTTLYFGIASHANWSMPGAQHAEFDVFIDTNDDNRADYVLFNFNRAAATGQLANNDVFVGALLKLDTFGRFVQTYTNGLAPDKLYLPLFNNNVMVLPVNAGDLNLRVGRTIQYQVVTYARESASAVDASPVIRFNPTKPAFDMTAGRAGPPVWRTLNGDSIPVKFNGGATFVHEPMSRTQGILLLHHLNELGTRVEVLTRTPELYYFPIIRSNR